MTFMKHMVHPLEHGFSVIKLTGRDGSGVGGGREKTYNNKKGKIDVTYLA